MPDKIDQLKIGSTSYDIDLPVDATPSIVSLTASSYVTSPKYNITVSGTTKAHIEYDSTDDAIKFKFD